MPSGITARLPTLEDLEAYAIGQWERFLLQLISSAQAERSINFCSSTMKVFQRGLLIQRDKEAPRLTESGFQFLLMDTNAQLWYIVREYISNSQVWLLIFFSVVSLHQNFCASLSLIHWIEYQLPNLIVGAITKESLYNAVENGLTAEQIRLWESDLNRVEMTPAHYYDEFPSRDVFEAACDYARDRSGLL
ncbi:RNA polymerase II transcription factor B subunit 2 [Citrus sinensis]|nr:RNA polymerase II transcription factor B subunit 2 [Citrus sinensis]